MSIAARIMPCLAAPLALSLVAAAAPGIAQPVAASTPADADASLPPEIAAALPDVDRIFADYQRESHSPGMVYGIVANGRLVHVKGLGVQDLEQRRPVSADSLFRIASMTKSFTALAILQLRDAGKLSLDDLAEKHVPQMRGWTYPADWPRIRVRDLLTHSAGLVTDNPWGDRQQYLPQAAFTAMLEAGVPLSRPAGTVFEYSNFGYAVLGRIVANVSGMAYADYMQRHILRPLGMASSGYDVAAAPLARRALGYRWEDEAWRPEPELADGAFNAMGGLQVSANDYARYVAFLLSAWPARAGEQSGPLPRASVRMLVQGAGFASLAQRPGASGGANACRQSVTYGFGMRVARDCALGLTLGHSGGYPGYGSFVLLMPDAGIGLFAFSNRTYNSSTPAVWDAAMALHRAGAIKPRPTPVSPLLAQGYAAAGRIYAAGDVLAAKDALAMNFLLDRDAAHWAQALADVKRQAGDCGTDAPIRATGALSGTFSWTCATGTVKGNVLLAPTANATIQELEFESAR
ncbi:serine hydrolase domain-containing protein [Sphingobium lignivorans]|uniref:CubicO group peptidase (Beta-lactamase class C family) n=1 Tax=Sphingobium lignivorans TaxID=2735886 RepID=A0ABR6NG85_9SPHN|nr:serine hydrolase domain-containing protein [Sphingobium lignivorans]MBB5986295.1 CubicO group peptidase (beta-lactamase class C family) [Sphingobium lignivorans]